MKTRPITRTFRGVLLFLLSFVLAQGVCVKTTLAKDRAAKKQQVATLNQNKQAEKRKEVLDEATAAVRETQNALQALDAGKTKEAMDALEKVSGKLDIILARDPEMALAPAAVNMETYDILANTDDVKALRKEIERALDKGRVQEARHMIRDLASETDISISNIPLGTYPDAIGQAVRFIDEKKIDAARLTLQDALNTLVITKTIIPLPVSDAEILLNDAESLVKKVDRSKDENTRLADLLDDARRDLEFAEALGYGSEKDFKSLYKELDKIEDQTQGGKSGTGLFDKIKGYLEDTSASSQHPEKRHAAR